MLCMALCGAGGTTGTPGAPEKTIGVPGSMPYVLSGKLGRLTIKGAVVHVLVRSS